MLPLPELAVFAAVAESGSFTAAARQLRLSKASVSGQVARLEAELGTRLLQRSTRRLTLTEAGEAALVHCRAMVREAEAARLAAVERHTEPVGTLRVACPESFCDLHIAPHCAGFLASHPALDIELSSGAYQADLIGERFDMAIRIGNLPDSSLGVKRIGTARNVIVAAPAFLERHPAIAAISDLEGMDILQFAPLWRGNEWLVLDRQGLEHRITGRCRLAVDSGRALIAAARSGAGLALLPDWGVADDLERGTLVQVLPGFGRAALPIQAVFPANRNPSAKVRAFIAWLETAWRGSSLMG